MKVRHAAAAIAEMARGFPALAIPGPRQSGKTTLARAMFPRYADATLEDPDSRVLPPRIPGAFSLGHEEGVVLVYGGREDHVVREMRLVSWTHLSSVRGDVAR
jgi:hypothetical protein